MSRKPSKTRCTATNANGRHCRAWAVRDTDPPLCSAHAGRNVGAGAPLGNQNRTEHGFYGRILQNGELADLQRCSDQATLDDEIGLVRVTLRCVMTRLSRYDLTQDDLTNEDLTKMAGLVMTGARTLARLLCAQNTLSGRTPDSFLETIGEALDELGPELGLQL